MNVTLTVSKQVASEILHNSINYAKNRSMDDLNRFIFLDPWGTEEEVPDSTLSSVLDDFEEGCPIMLFLEGSELWIQKESGWAGDPNVYEIDFHGKGEVLFSENVLGGNWFTLKSESELAQIKASMYDADKSGPWYDY